jgi:hypothetical protein
VLDGSPLGDRGRRATRRTRTKTATQRDQDGSFIGDLPTGDRDGEGVDGDGEDEEEEEEFSDILADAILKRPESIRDGSLRSMRKDSRGKAIHANENGVGSPKKEEVNLNGDGECRGGREDEDADGWIMGPCTDAPRPTVSAADDNVSWPTFALHDHRSSFEHVSVSFIPWDISNFMHLSKVGKNGFSRIQNTHHDSLF